MQAAIARVSQAQSRASAQLQSFHQGERAADWSEVRASLEHTRQSLQHMMGVRDQLVSRYRDLKGREG